MACILRLLVSLLPPLLQLSCFLCIAGPDTSYKLLLVICDELLDESSGTRVEVLHLRNPIFIFSNCKAVKFIVLCQQGLTILRNQFPLQIVSIVVANFLDGSFSFVVPANNLNPVGTLKNIWNRVKGYITF